jgi:hypothetical protein
LYLKSRETATNPLTPDLEAFMSLLLPSSNSSLRELFDIETLINWKELPTFNPTLNSARKHAREQRRNGVKEVFCIAMRANSHIWLFRVGPRGGWKKLWDFGSPV